MLKIKLIKITDGWTYKFPNNYIFKNYSDKKVISSEESLLKVPVYETKTFGVTFGEDFGKTFYDSSMTHVI